MESRKINNRGQESNFAQIPVREYVGADEMRRVHGAAPLVCAIHYLQAWILELQEKKAAYIEPGAGHILHIKSDAKHQFFFGIAENHIFLGVPEKEMKWFQALPWLHVAMRKSSDRMNIVCEETTVQNVTLPYFSLTFHVNDSSRLNLLSKIKQLHIRELHIAHDGRVEGVSQKIAFTIDIVEVEDDRNISGLLADKHPWMSRTQLFRNTKK